MIVAHANHLVASGHDVCITTAVFDTVFLLDPRISLNHLSTTYKLGTILSALITKLDADLIIADIIPMACFLFFRNRRKVLFFAQDYDESYYSSLFLKWLVRFFYLVGLKLCHIPSIAVSHPLDDLLRKRFNANVFVAENGVDTNIFYPDSDQDMVAAKGDRKAVLLLSRSDRRKGFDIAQTVIGRVRETHADIFEVWTVGESCTGAFKGIVHRDFGYVVEERLRQIMSSADIFLYPTRHEGFPLMAVEAFACRCPLVTSEAVPFAQDGLNALVTTVGDVENLAIKVGQLLDDGKLAGKLAAEGLLFAAEHSLSKSLDEYANLIAHLVPDSGRC